MDFSISVSPWKGLPEELKKNSSGLLGFGGGLNSEWPWSCNFLRNVLQIPKDSDASFRIVHVFLCALNTTNKIATHCVPLANNGTVLNWWKTFMADLFNLTTKLTKLSEWIDDLCWA